MADLINYGFLVIAGIIALLLVGIIWSDIYDWWKIRGGRCRFCKEGRLRLNGTYEGEAYWNCPKCGKLTITSSLFAR